MKKIFLLISVIILTYSCKENERMIFDGNNQIYFPTVQGEMDSVVLSMMGNKNGATYHIPVMLVGKTPKIDQTYKIEVDTSKTTAKEGIHYKMLEEKYTFKAGNIVDYIPLILFREDEELTKKKVVLYLRLVESSGLELAYEQKTGLRVLFSLMLRKPVSQGTYGDVTIFNKVFGPYSQIKHELIVSDKILGHDLYDGEKMPAGVTRDYTFYYNESYLIPFGKKLYKYLIDNVVIDEDGNQLKPWTYKR